jgi:hypothetical protein
MITNISDIYSVHYNMCRKPWNCIGEGTRTNKAESSIPEDQVNLVHCMELLTMWHTVRTDLETTLSKRIGNATVDIARKGDYQNKVFQGARDTVEATIWHWLLPRKWFEESATCTVNNRTNQHRLPSYITMSGSTSSKWKNQP